MSILNLRRIKKIMFILTLLFSFCIYAQENEESKNDNDDGITGFYGIPFGSNKETVIKMMKEKGWTKAETGNDKQFGEYVNFKGGTYASKKISGFNRLSFSFYNNEFYMSDLSYGIDYDSRKKDEDTTWIRNVISGTVAKYNLKQTSSDKTSQSYEGANQNQLKIISNATKYTLWFDIRSIDYNRFAEKFILKSVKEADGVINSDDL